MKKFQSAIKVCLLFMILSLLSILPIEITHIQNKELFSQVHIKNISTELQTVYRPLKTKEKLAAIVDPSNGFISTLVDRNKILKRTDNKSYNDIIEQLELLKKIGVIPLIDFNRELKIAWESKTIYLQHFNNYQDMISTKDIVLIVQSYTIDMKVDMETSVIYEIAVYTEGKLPEFKTQFNPISFIDYLNLPINNFSVKGFIHEGYLIYQDKTFKFVYQYTRNAGLIRLCLLDFATYKEITHQN